MDDLEKEPQLRGPVRMTAVEFVVQLVHQAAKAQGGEITLHTSSPQVHRAFKIAFDKLHEQAEEEGIDPRFVVAPRPDYGQSASVSEGLSTLLMLRMATCSSWDDTLTYNTQYMVNTESVEEGNLPGIPDLFKGLANIFLAEINKPLER